jgi:hypothetical protein
VTRSTATYPAEFGTPVIAVSISPALVASRSPWNRLSMDIRASVEPSAGWAVG